MGSTSNPLPETGDPCLIPGSGRSPAEGNVYTLQYSCLENPKDRGAWKATIHSDTKIQTQLKLLSKDTSCNILFILDIKFLTNTLFCGWIM